jgi:hypothetical protein
MYTFFLKRNKQEKSINKINEVNSIKTTFSFLKKISILRSKCLSLRKNDNLQYLRLSKSFELVWTKNFEEPQFL